MARSPNIDHVQDKGDPELKSAAKALLKRMGKEGVMNQGQVNQMTQFEAVQHLLRVLGETVLKERRKYTNVLGGCGFMSSKWDV